MRAVRPSLVALACALSVSLSFSACDTPDPSAGDVDVLAPTDPRLAMAVADVDPMTGEVRSWATAPLDAEDDAWIGYPGNVQLDISHGLGRTPNAVLVYLAFTPDGRFPALAAGDLARIIEVDASHVVVANGTNGNYFARVVVF